MGEGDMNVVHLIGRLGRDPEIRCTAQGTAVCKFSLATAERWNDASGQKQEKTSWHNIVVWEKLAESCGQYLAKGRQVAVVGSTHTREYDDRDGTKRWITEVTAREVEFLGGTKGEGPAAAVVAPAGEDQPPREPQGDDPDDLSF
jgi:single-strand DNA-binding protein